MMRAKVLPPPLQTSLHSCVLLWSATDQKTVVCLPRLPQSAATNTFHALLKVVGCTRVNECVLTNHSPKLSTAIVVSCLSNSFLLLFYIIITSSTVLLFLLLLKKLQKTPSVLFQ